MTGFCLHPHIKALSIRPNRMGFYLKTEIKSPISETLVKKQSNEWCQNNNCINVPLSHTLKWKPKSPHRRFRRRRSFRKAWHAFRDACVGNSDGWVNPEDWRVRRNHTCAAKMRWCSRSFSQQQGLSFKVNNGCSKFPKNKEQFGNTPKLTSSRLYHFPCNSFLPDSFIVTSNRTG